ncbi:ROK family protein [Candidatus Daviesbacteria bacterium]|nr:ROK family protein [Candidatus Daviesbacteria bacterium]
MYLVFDIGGTKMRIAVSSDGRQITQSKIIPTPKDFDQAIQTFKKVADEISGGKKIEVIAGGLAGPLDKDKTMLITSPHLGGWIEKPFKAELEKLFGCPVYLENDANLAALGEATYGAGVNHKIVAYLTISTGVGGGRVVNKKIDENSLGFEPGHQIIVPDGSPCNCGGKGHLESYVSGSGLERTYGKKAEEIKDSKIWDEVERYLAIGLNNVTVLWSPDIIILGGSVMQSINIESVRTYLKEILTIFPRAPKIELAKLGDSVGLYGALSLI